MNPKENKVQDEFIAALEKQGCVVRTNVGKAPPDVTLWRGIRSKLYKVTLISRIADWNCTFEITAKSKRAASKNALNYLRAPTMWLVTNVEKMA